MQADAAEAIAKLHEIEQQATTALAELPMGSIAYSRLRHIAILARFARMKLEGVRVDPMASMTGGQTLDKPSSH